LVSYDGHSVRGANDLNDFLDKQASVFVLLEFFASQLCFSCLGFYGVFHTASACLLIRPFVCGVGDGDWTRDNAM